MKISQKDAIRTKNLHLSKQCGARRLLSELPDKGWKLGSINSPLKRRRVQMSGNQSAADRVWCVAVEDLVQNTCRWPIGLVITYKCAKNFCKWTVLVQLMWLPDCYKILKICLLVSTEYTNVTDRQMDRQTDRQTERQCQTLHDGISHTHAIAQQK